MAFMPKVFINHHNWYSSTIGSLKSANLASLDNHHFTPSLLYNYDHTVHGFAAHRSKHELEALKSHQVLSQLLKTGLPLFTQPTPLSFFPSILLLAYGWLQIRARMSLLVSLTPAIGLKVRASRIDDGMSKKIPDKGKGTCE